MSATSVIHSHNCYTTAVPPFQSAVNPPKPRGSSVYRIVTDAIIKQLENGVIPWHKPWSTAFPKSLRSLREYRGINVLLLSSQGYSSPYWTTFNQATQLGGHIKQGEHSTFVTFWKRRPYKTHNAETGEDETRQGFLLRYYRVFNLCQTEGIAEKLGLSTAGEFSRVPNLEQCEAIVQGMRLAPRFESSNAAWYRPLTDTVGMPSRDTFDSPETYYATLFHELGHATGHPSRLKRDGIENVNSFASESYSKEELIAEMSSAFLCGVSGISPVTLTNSAGYLQSWISRLRGDSRLLISAASAAQKAADYILGKQEPIQDTGSIEA
jgi:antirestriction protein ArdC